MLQLKSKKITPSNLHFYYGILDAEKKNQDTLYSKRDLPLLSYYHTLRNHAKNDVILMQAEYYREMLAERFIRKNYLSIRERAQYRTFILNNIFVDDFNNRLDGEYIYGLLPDHRLYMAPIHEVRNHSHLIAGLPVIAIGHAYIDNGYLITISNNSGHYKPLLSIMKPGIKWFIENISHDFLIEDHSTISPEELYGGVKIYLASTVYQMPTQALEKTDVELFINHLCTVVLPQKSEEAEKENEEGSNEEENHEENLLTPHTVISSHLSTGYQNAITNNQHQPSINIQASLDTEEIPCTENVALPREIESSLVEKFTSIQRSTDYCRFNKIRKEWRAT